MPTPDDAKLQPPPPPAATASDPALETPPPTPAAQSTTGAPSAAAPNQEPPRHDAPPEPLGTPPGPGPKTPATVAPAGQAAVDVWSTRLAAWSQIATVIVVVFGYFYTVRPVFQLQLLQEQTAQLQLDNDAAKRKLALTQLAQEKATADLTRLNGELTALAKTRESLESELHTETQREIKAMEDRAIAEGKLTTQSGTLLLAQRRVLYARVSDRFSLLGLRWTFPTYIDFDDASGKSLADAQAAWPDLYAQISAALDHLETDDKAQQEYPVEMLRPLRRVLEDKKADLVCEPFPAESLSRDYREEMSKVDAAARKDAIDDIEKQRAAAAAKHTRLIVRDGDIAAYTQNYRLGRAITIQQKYNDKVNALRDACGKKGKAVLAAMEKQI